MSKSIGCSLGLLMVVSAVLLSACGGGGGSHTPAVTEVVPAAVTSDAAAATTYITALTSAPASQTDNLEPLPVPESLASSDTEEPTPVTE